MASKWGVRKWRCRRNYRDGCRPVWYVSSPDEDAWFSPEFDTWQQAINYVNHELAARGGWTHG